MAMGGFCKNARRQRIILQYQGRLQKTTIGNCQGILKVIQHALMIANFTTDWPALLEINRNLQ